MCEVINDISANYLSKMSDYLLYYLDRISYNEKINIDDGTIVIKKISPEERESIREFFMRFYRAYRNLYPKCYFLNYNFVLQKICYMLDYNDIAKKFPQFKSKEQIEFCEKRWEDLCESVGPNYSKLF